MTEIEKIKCGRCKGTGIDPELPDNQICKKCSGFKVLDWVQNITGFRLTRKEKSILYVLNTLNVLAEQGLVTDGGIEIDEKAKKTIEQFKPTEEELQETMAILNQEGIV